MTRQLKVWLCASAAAIFAASSALAQSTAANPSEWNRPYGQAYGSETQAYVGARMGGNRVVLNGDIPATAGATANTQTAQGDAANDR